MSASKEDQIVDAEFEVIVGPLEAPAPLPFKQRLHDALGWWKYLIWGLWIAAGLALLAGEVLPALGG